jgi:hypothetical protein
MDLYPVVVRLRVVKNVAQWTEANRFPVNHNRVACCGRDDCGNFMLVFQNDTVSHRILAHEISHCTFRIAEYIGMPHADESDEAYAALHEHITGWAYREFAKHGCKVS